jgi:single-strand DNA-binding protein
MMNGINKIFLAGNLVRKPVLHKNKNGKVFSFLKIATNRYSYNEGNWDKKTDWHSILVWGRKAELCERFLDKGTPLAIEGFLENGQNEKTLIIAMDVHFLGARTAVTTESEAAGESEKDEEAWEPENNVVFS